MSPLKIIALLRLYAYANPLDDMPAEQANSPAMRKAYEWFDELGLLAPGVTFDVVKSGAAGYPLLSERGLDLVNRLRGVEP